MSQNSVTPAALSAQAGPRIVGRMSSSCAGSSVCDPTDLDDFVDLVINGEAGAVLAEAVRNALAD